MNIDISEVANWMPNTNGKDYIGIPEIAKWKIDASHKANERYFFENKAVAPIRSGDAVLVIGRKGTGKTAIALNLVDEASPTTFAAYLDFRELRTAVAGCSPMHGPDGINPWITVWKAILGHQLVQLMAQNQSIGGSAAPDILHFLANSPLNHRELERFRPTKLSTNIKIPYFEFNRSTDIAPKLDDTIWMPIQRKSRELFCNHAGNAKYYVLIDCVGDDVKTISDEYEQIVIGLIKAAISMRVEASNAGVNVFPCVFLRDDIFQELVDPDASKWSDYSARLEWGEHSLKGMLGHRLQKAYDINPKKGYRTFNGDWALVSNVTRMEDHTSKRRIEIFEWIWQRTHSRPRDFVRYLRIAARHALAANSAFIRSQDMESAAKKYSEEFRDEIIHEMTSKVPNAKDVFELLQQIGSSTFPFKKFEEKYAQAMKGMKDVLPARDIAKILYRYNVIGCPYSGNQNIVRFRYNHSGSEYSEGQPMCVHRSLCKGLMMY